MQVWWIKLEIGSLLRWLRGQGEIRFANFLSLFI